MGSASAVFKGFGVTCPRCHDSDATVGLDLRDLTAISCSGCNEEFTPTQARDLAAAELARWEAIVRWVDLAEGTIAGTEGGDR